VPPVASWPRRYAAYRTPPSHAARAEASWTRLSAARSSELIELAKYSVSATTPKQIHMTMISTGATLGAARVAH